MVDCSKLLSLYYNTPNCLVIDLGPSGVKCLPVRNNEALKGFNLIHHVPIKEKMEEVMINNFSYYESYCKTFTKLAVIPSDQKVKVADFLVSSDYSFEQNVTSEQRLNLGAWYMNEILPIIEKAFCSLREMDSSLLENIVIVGGFSHLEGMHERLLKEITRLSQGATPSLTFQEKKAPNLSKHLKNLKRTRRGADMDIMGGAKILCNQPNARYLFTDMHANSTNENEEQEVDITPSANTIQTTYKSSKPKCNLQ